MIVAQKKQSLESVLSNKDIQLYYDPLAETGLLESAGHHLSFGVGDAMILLDYSKVKLLDTPVTKENGKLYVGADFVECMTNLFAKKEVASYYKVAAILIDAGHGGKDPGASSSFKIDGKKLEVVEKDVNLNIALELYKKLKALYPDKNILLTRDKDKFLTLSERTQIANSVKLSEHEAILYISIHVNASIDERATGFEVWYLSPGYRRQVLDKNNKSEVDKSLLPILNSMLEEEYTTESILIANFINEGIKKAVGKQSHSRGLKAEEWFVVRNTNMPSVLVETGFLTNEKEAALLSNKKYLSQIALGICNGISEFVMHFENSRGFTGMSDDE